MENENQKKDTRVELMQEVARRLNARWKQATQLRNEAAGPPPTHPRPRFPEMKPMPARKNRGAIPGRLYKYMKRRYAQDMIERGSLLIGTLHGYRNVELGPGIADVEEGKKDLVHQVDYLRLEAGSKEAQDLARLGLVEIADGNTAIFWNARFTTLIDHHDAYVWCCSRSKSPDAMNSLHGADTCVEIFDVPNFFRALAAAMSARTDFPSVGPLSVTYGERAESWDLRDPGKHPVFMKGSEFEAQQEVRIAWIPATAPKMPLARMPIEQSEVFRYCRIVGEV